MTNNTELDLIALQKDESRRDFKEAYPRTDNERREKEKLTKWRKNGNTVALQAWTGEVDYMEADHGEAPRGV